MAHVKNHDYHVLPPSIWPFLGGVGGFVMLFGAVIWMAGSLDIPLSLVIGGPLMIFATLLVLLYAVLRQSAMRADGRNAEAGRLGTLAIVTGAFLLVQLLLVLIAGPWVLTIGTLVLAGPWLFLIGLVAVLYTMYGWWADVVAESRVGDHTPVVRIGLRYGFILFIMSEVMFFAAWFWSFFKHAMYPMGPESPAVDGVWPPPGIETFDPWHLPLINTLILLCSGAAATWAHHALVHENNRKDMQYGLILAIGLGALFTVFQIYEYSHAAFGFAGNIYGANFFMATGFHGAHVIIGTIFLAVCLFRATRGHFTPEKHVGFEAAAWYWHFVDVVWLFLFFAVYIWGG